MKNILEKYGEIFSPEEIKIFQENSEKKRQVVFRTNLAKSSDLEIESELKKNNIGFEKGFLPNSFILRPEYREKDLWNLDIYKDGKIYLQSLSSQLVPYFFDQNYSQEKLKILDATAAPGGKTSLLATLFPKSEIYAFEKSKIRYEKMLYNLKKLGIKNVLTYNLDVTQIKNIFFEEYFDFILLDAPCSSEGRLTSKENNQKGEKFYYNIQKNIVDNIIPCLKTNGELIYSTCTINPLENEGLVHYVISKNKNLKIEKLDKNIIVQNNGTYIKNGIQKYKKYIFHPSITETIRVFPTSFSDGFFIAKLKKI